MRPESPLPIVSVTILSSLNTSVPGSASVRYLSIVAKESAFILSVSSSFDVGARPVYVPPAAEMVIPAHAPADCFAVLYSIAIPPPPPAQPAQLLELVSSELPAIVIVPLPPLAYDCGHTG